MTVREILLYPNPILRVPGEPVTPEQLASDEIQQLIADMVETMYHFPGTVGLAAPQVGASVQIFVMDATVKTAPRERLKVMINPKFIEQSQWKYSREGCLSFPDYLVTVKRARKMQVEYLDPEGNVHVEDFRDFEAIIIQHETDHLNGILFLDRVRNIEADVVMRSSLPAQQG